ncbi:MAG: hypothetical protein ABSF98_24535 [Bryobacteraceae bacterium]
MPQALRNDRDGHAIAQKAAGVGVPQGMQADALQPDFPHEFDHPGTQTVGRIVGAIGLAENQIVIVVVRAEELAIPLLFLAVCAQHLERPLGDGETPRLF